MVTRLDEKCANVLLSSDEGAATEKRWQGHTVRGILAPDGISRNALASGSERRNTLEPDASAFRLMSLSQRSI